MYLIQCVFTTSVCCNFRSFWLCFSWYSQSSWRENWAGSSRENASKLYRLYIPSKTNTVKATVVSENRL